MSFDFNSYTRDSTGAFLVGELQVKDQTLHLPLTSVTWHRDILTRTDATIADDTTSFTNSSFASFGGNSASGKSWAGRRTNANPGVSLDIQQTITPLHIWSKEVDWTVIELESAMKLGRPIDTQKVDALNLLFNMDLDAQVYVGDSELNVGGLANSSAVTNSTAALHTDWTTATAVEILDTIREVEESAWKESAYAFAPSKVLVDPVSYAKLLSPLTIGGVAFNSIAEYISRNSLCMAVNGKPLEIVPVKWLNDFGGVSGDKRIVAYTNDYDKVRIAATPLQRTPIEFRGLYQLTTYFAKIGSVEVVYPSTVAYRTLHY